ncbi:MAG: helix-turn-helix transcriptional regulator [Phycisphaerae bacterium]
MLELGKAIRIVRDAKGIRLAALAERSGVSVPFLSLVEHGERQPSLAVLRKIADGLGIPAEVLIMLSQPTGGHLQSNDRTTQSLVTAIQKLLRVEDDLRSKLASEAKPRARKKTHG